jgi:hypothetical protein
VKVLFRSEPVGASSLKLKENNILNMLGVPEGEGDEHLMTLIRDLMDQCLKICSPRASCSVYPDPLFNIDSGSMTIGGLSFALNKMVTKAMLNSSEIAFFIGTCGETVEQYSRQLMKEGQSLEGYIVDIVGSEIAEGVAGYVHKKLESESAVTGFKTTNRYSPGYCQWSVSDQQKLFSLMGDSHCDVRLSASSLMVPLKSVTGIIGLGKDVENKGYACFRCDADHCLYREKNYP